MDGASSPEELPGAPMDSDSDPSTKYKPVEPLTLDPAIGSAAPLADASPPKPIKPKRKRRTSVQMIKEGLEEGAKAVGKIGGKLKSAGRAVGKAAASSKPKKDKKTGDTARDLHSRRDIQLKMKAAYGVVVMMAAISFVLVIIELEILTKGYLDTGTYAQTGMTQTLKGIISFCSLISAGFMMRYYQHWFSYLVVTQGTMYLKRQRHWLRLQFLAELLLVTLHVPPGVDLSFRDEFVVGTDGSGSAPTVLYHVDILGMVVLLRVYLLPRCVLFFSELWSSNTVAMVAALREVSITTGMAMKSIFKKHKILMTFFTCLVPLVTCSYLFSFCERLANPYWAEGGFFPYNAFYNMFLSFAGEVAAEPNTWGGRFAVIIQVILGLFGTALLLSQVLSAMELDMSQQLLMKTVAERKQKGGLKLSAARTIQRLWRLFAAIKSAQASGEMSPIARDGLLRTPSFKFKEKDIDRMVKGEDMMAYKKHVWGVMREWKRAKRAPLEFEEDYQTTLQNTSKELLSKVRDVNDDVHALTKQVFGSDSDGARSPSPLETKILKVESKLERQVANQLEMQQEMKIIAESLVSLKNMLSTKTS